MYNLTYRLEIEDLKPVVFHCELGEQEAVGTECLKADGRTF